jgi:predicted dehydrogenase
VNTLNFAIIGCGGVTLQNHLPGLALCADVKLVALCDADAATLERARGQAGVAVMSTRFEDIVKRDDVHAVIIATPNFTHKPIALAAIANGKHVLCEKPLALNHADAKAMADAERAGAHDGLHLFRAGDALPAHLVPRIPEAHDIVHAVVSARATGWRQVKKPPPGN